MLGNYNRILVRGETGTNMLCLFVGFWDVFGHESSALQHLLVMVYFLGFEMVSDNFRCIYKMYGE